jgi:hypothetical protein
MKGPAIRLWLVAAPDGPVTVTGIEDMALVKSCEAPVALKMSTSAIELVVRSISIDVNVPSEVSNDGRVKLSVKGTALVAVL